MQVTNVKEANTFVRRALSQGLGSDGAVIAPRRTSCQLVPNARDKLAACPTARCGAADCGSPAAVPGPAAAARDTCAPPGAAGSSARAAASNFASWNRSQRRRRQHPRRQLHPLAGRCSCRPPPSPATNAPASPAPSRPSRSRPSAPPTTRRSRPSSPCPSTPRPPHRPRPILSERHPIRTASPECAAANFCSSASYSRSLSRARLARAASASGAVGQHLHGCRPGTRLPASSPSPAPRPGPLHAAARRCLRADLGLGMANVIKDLGKVRNDVRRAAAVGDDVMDAREVGRVLAQQLRGVVGQFHGLEGRAALFRGGGGVGAGAVKAELDGDAGQVR